jgi:hypothetical protein
MTYKQKLMALKIGHASFLSGRKTPVYSAKASKHFSSYIWHATVNANYPSML